MKPGKSPGPDGLHTQYYKSLSEILMPHFLRTFNYLSQCISPPTQYFETHILVIHTKGKDTKQVQNYRPISLLNVDLKICANILANRLLPLLPNLVSQDQVGFVPGREAHDNTIKTPNIYHMLTNTATEGFFLSTDTEKALDRVAWDYMSAVLASIGLWSFMQSSILTFYSNPQVRVKVNGHLSDTFFLCCIRSHPDISGVKTEQRIQNCCLCNDILLFLTNPKISLPNLLHKFKQYGELSNFKINLNKALALNLTLPQALAQSCQESFSFS